MLEHHSTHEQSFPITQACGAAILRISVAQQPHRTSAREVFGHIESVKIHVILNPAGSMLTSSSGFAIIHARYIPSIDSSNMIGNSPEFSNFNRLFLKLNRFICN